MQLTMEELRRIATGEKLIDYCEDCPRRKSLSCRGHLEIDPIRLRCIRETKIDGEIIREGEIVTACLLDIDTSLVLVGKNTPGSIFRHWCSIELLELVGQP